MLEASRLAHRTAALPVGGEGAVRVLPAASRFSLRVKGVFVPHAEVPGRARPRSTHERGASFEAPLLGAPQDEEVGGGQFSALGVPLALPINRCTVSGDRTIARLGPDEWLVLGSETDTETMAGEITGALAERFHALVDISHRNVAFAVSGPGAADILNAGCPLDLHPSAFPAGAATRTLLGKAEIVLLRPATEPVFRVECWRSFAVYVHGFLEEAARDV